MADIRSSQLVVQAETQKPPLLKASQVICQCEFELLPYGTYVGHITFELIPESTTVQTFAYTGDVTFSLTPDSTYGIGIYFTPTCEITFSLIPESDTVVDFVYTGDISFALIPESDIIGDYGYNGIITFELIPESAYATPIPGFDWYSGYGLVDLTFLDGNPPYYVTEGDIPITVTPSAVIELYAEHELTASGGIEISGAGVIEFETPPVYEIVATGGVVFGGRGTIEHVTPSIFELVGSGGVKCNGAGTIEFIDPGDIELPIFELVGSGEVRVNGDGVIEFPALVIYEVVGSGGIEIDGAGIVELPDKPAEYEITASGGVKVTGTSIIEFFTPDVIFELIGTGGIEIDGEGAFVYTYPLTFEVIAEGGVEIGGEYEAFTYHTWVIIGPTFKPSIYSGFDFNSYSEHQGKCYGLKDDGLYLLEGSSDNGEDIHTGMSLGGRNFGSEGRNKVRSIRFGDRDGDDINVKVSDDNGEAYGALSRNRKAMINRSVFGDNLNVEIADFEKLSSVEIEVVHRK